MAGIYVYSDDTLIVGELINKVRTLSKDVYALAFSADSAEEIKTYGANEVYYLKGNSPIVENYSDALAIFLKRNDAELFVVGSTARGRDLAAQVSGHLGCAMISDAQSLDRNENGDILYERMTYGGAVVQSIVVEGLGVATVPAGKFDAMEDVASEITTIEVPADERVRLVSSDRMVTEGVDLALADKVVCVGLGMDKEEDLQMAEDLASVIGAELGCTRGVAEERHWLPVERYIGISGETVKPSLFISMGVSGQVQHTVGVRDAKIMVAVDTNEKAPIFNTSDYGIVGSMYEIVPLLTKALSSSK
jgi:electron transfer flavoprotein alpha subunit